MLGTRLNYESTLSPSCSIRLHRAQFSRFRFCHNTGDRGSTRDRHQTGWRNLFDLWQAVQFAADSRELRHIAPFEWNFVSNKEEHEESASVV